MRPVSLITLLALFATRVIAQSPTSLTRAEAVSRALGSAPQSAIAGATARMAAAELLSARAFPNPIVNGTYSKSVPQWHVTAELPVDFLWLRSLRVGAARSSAEAARLQLAFDRGAVTLAVDTLYTRAAAAASRAALSHRNAVAADSLLVLSRVRRDAGDASDLDVELARVNAGQAENAAATDSLEGMGALLDLQAGLGLSSREVAVTLADSLAAPSTDSAAVLIAQADSIALGAPLPVAAAERELRAAEQSLALAHRSVWSGFALTGGVEWQDPDQPGTLPTFGVSVPFPLFDRRRGEIALATATRDRAAATLALARVQAAAALAHTRRELQVALARLARDATIVASADRVAAMSLRAYAEGAYAITNVLEAQRNARDALAQLIADAAAANVAAATLRLYTMTVTP